MIKIYFKNIVSDKFGYKIEWMMYEAIYNRYSRGYYTPLYSTQLNSTLLNSTQLYTTLLYSTLLFALTLYIEFSPLDINSGSVSTA